MSAVRLFVGAAVAAAVMTPGAAQARIILVTTGDQIRELGPVRPSAGSSYAGLKVGYKNDYAGLFWVDFATWNGGYCVVDDRGYDPVSPAVAARLLGVREADLPTPFFARFPAGLVALAGLAVGFGLLRVVGSAGNDREDRRAAELLADPVYQNAAALVSGTGPTGLAAGVKFLVENGVPQAAARANLAAIAWAWQRASDRAVPLAAAPPDDQSGSS